MSWSAAIAAGAADLRLANARFRTVATLAVMIALTLAVVLMFGLVAGNKPPLQPTPSPSASPSHLTTTAAADRFIVPFTFERPLTTTFQWALDSRDIQGFLDSASPVSIAESGAMMSQASRGVFIGALGTPWHHCPNGESVPTTPRELLDTLGTDGGLGLGEITPATLDGRPALTASFAAGSDTCSPDFHVTHGPTRASESFLLSTASVLTVLDVGGTTVVVDIWADSDEELAAWLPEATTLVNSIHFFDAQ